MKIEMVPIEAVKPYEKNPRQNDSAVDAVARSIREFGFRQPIVVDEKGVVVVGHTRLILLRQVLLPKRAFHPVFRGKLLRSDVQRYGQQH